MVDYSICLTTYNCEPEARSFVESLNVSERTVELVVVDAGSTDDTRDALREFDGSVQISVVEGCTRGEGRQRAVELATHSHIVSELDVDCRYEGLDAVLDVYEKEVEDNDALLIRGNNGLIVAPTSLLREYPYRPLQYREDHALHDRLYKANRLSVVSDIPTVEIRENERIERVSLPNGEKFLAAELIKNIALSERLVHWYGDVKCMYQIGYHPRQIITHNIKSMSPIEVAVTLPLTIAGLLLVRGKPRYDDALAHCADELYHPLHHKCYTT